MVWQTDSCRCSLQGMAELFRDQEQCQDAVSIVRTDTCLMGDPFPAQGARQHTAFDLLEDGDVGEKR
jgi:hypothetical protein